tara:strand:+ start:8247 stop:10085 length:1839 start_codon:yes stop_codon:yes gene_type:complete
MATAKGSDSMKIDTRDILKIGEYGFVRDLHPAFNVSQNRYGYKSSYTKNLFYALQNRSSKTVFFSRGILKGQIIRKTKDKFDFVVSEFKGKAYIVKQKGKATEINDGKKLKGHIIFNIHNHFVDIIDWQDSVDWSGKGKSNRVVWDNPDVEWESEDDFDSQLETDDAVKNLIEMQLSYEADYFEIAAQNDDKYKLKYLKGIVDAYENAIECIQRGGVEKGVDAIARVYLNNAKRTYNKHRKESVKSSFYSEEFYYVAGLVFGYRDVSEFLTGFSEEWQYQFASESDSATLKKYEKTYGKAGAKVRLKLKNKIMKQNTHGTKSGQWSARKSQKLKQEYEKAMEKKGSNPYKSNKKTKAQKDLKDWGDQKWRTKSGKKSSVTGERYLPEKAIKALSDKEYARTTAAKRKAKKAGKQVSKQPKDIAKKVAKYRAEYKTGTQGPCWDGYTYVGPRPFTKGSCVKRAEYTPDHEMSDYSLQDLSMSSVVEGDFAKDSLKFSFMEGMRAEDVKKKDYTKMSPADIQMKAPDGWKIVGFYDSKGTNYQLKRKITFDHFDEVEKALGVINSICYKLDHHPIIEYSYKYILISLWTHDVNGLTDLDFRFAKMLNKGLDVNF